MRYIGGAGEKAFPAGAVCNVINIDFLSSHIRTQVAPEAQSVMSDYNQSRPRTASAGASTAQIQIMHPNSNGWLSASLKGYMRSL